MLKMYQGGGLTHYFCGFDDRSALVQGGQIGQLAVSFIGVHAAPDQIPVWHLECAPVSMMYRLFAHTYFFSQNTAAHREAALCRNLFRYFTECETGIQDAIDKQHMPSGDWKLGFTADLEFFAAAMSAVAADRHAVQIAVFTSDGSGQISGKDQCTVKQCKDGQRLILVVSGNFFPETLDAVTDFSF
jgi:hypothetical protein